MVFLLSSVVVDHLNLNKLNLKLKLNTNLNNIKLLLLKLILVKPMLKLSQTALKPPTTT